jgi:acetyl-CoA C-acetyltransferase
MPAVAQVLDPRTPVVVAVGQTDQRTDDPTSALEPIALLVEAARHAAADGGTDRLLDALDTVAVVRILSWRYRDPAALVAAGLGISPRRTIETDDGGNYPQALMNRACGEIQAGTADAVLIGGAEAGPERSSPGPARTIPSLPPSRWSTPTPSPTPASGLAAS